MTVNQIRAALDRLVAERPECGEMAVAFHDESFGLMRVHEVKVIPADVDVGYGRSSAAAFVELFCDRFADDAALPTSTGER